MLNRLLGTASPVDAPQGTAKYKPHVNFSDAVFACCAFLRRSAADPLPLLQRRLLPLRPGRTAPRPKITGNRISACYASGLVIRVSVLPLSVCKRTTRKDIS